MQTNTVLNSKSQHFCVFSRSSVYHFLQDFLYSSAAASQSTDAELLSYVEAAVSIGTSGLLQGSLRAPPAGQNQT